MAGPKPYYPLDSGHSRAEPICWPYSFKTALLHPKALWKLDWFLRDFGYDTELLGRDEVDESSSSV